ncbi:MAG: hypothetical protein IKZ95_06185 [Lachnospiraceae bacterium]|nr:hypothetical protein [Lachnospiraceae bacterium]
MEQEGKVEKIITRIVIGILFAFLLSIIVVAILIKAGRTELFRMDHSIETKVYEIGKEDNVLRKVSKGYSNAVYAAKNYTDAYSNDLLLGRRKIVETEVRYKNLIGFKIYAPGEYNSLLYLEDGYLASANPKESPEDIQKIATKIKGLSDTAKEAGATFFYMQTPGNIDKYGDPEINQVQDFANYNADLLVEDLKAYGIDCLDIRDNMHVAFDDYRSLFFRTDHHWRQPVALWATNELCAYMQEQYGFTYDASYYDPDQYEVEVLPEHYLGSLGRKATLAETMPDDFELMHPKFETDMELCLDKKGPFAEKYEQEGSWEILYDREEMEYDDIYWRECYLALLAFYGTGKASVKNVLADNETTIAIVGDSLCIPVTAFLALNAKKVVLIDPRYFDGSIKDYILKTKPDFVISSYSTTIIQDYYPIFDFDKQHEKQ